MLYHLSFRLRSATGDFTRSTDSIFDFTLGQDLAQGRFDWFDLLDCNHVLQLTNRSLNVEVIISKITDAVERSRDDKRNVIQMGTNFSRCVMGIDLGR